MLTKKIFIQIYNDSCHTNDINTRSHVHQTKLFKSQNILNHVEHNICITNSSIH